MKSVFRCNYLLMPFILLCSFNMAHAGIEDIIEEMRESEGAAITLPHYSLTSSGYVEYALGQGKLSIDFMKKAKLVTLKKTELQDGIRVVVEERSSRPVLWGDLTKFSHAAGDKPIYYLADLKRSSEWVDVVEDVCCYPVSLVANSADGGSYATVLRSNPIGYIDINYKSIVLSIYESKGMPVTGDISLQISGLGKVGSNELKLKIASNVTFEVMKDIRK